MIDEPLLYLADTNVLLRLTKQDRAGYPIVRNASTRLQTRGISFAFTLQNIAEFWNVSTRPLSRNGFGLSIDETAEDVDEIERDFTFLPDTAFVYHHWRRLVAEYKVSGIQVHDARLAASMIAHGLTHVLTFNTTDFARFDGIVAVHPASVEQVLDERPLIS